MNRVCDLGVDTPMLYGTFPTAERVSGREVRPRAWRAWDDFTHCGGSIAQPNFPSSHARPVRILGHRQETRDRDPPDHFDQNGLDLGLGAQDQNVCTKWVRPVAGLHAYQLSLVRRVRYGYECIPRAQAERTP